MKAGNAGNAIQIQILTPPPHYVWPDAVLPKDRRKEVPAQYCKTFLPHFP